MLIQVTSRRFYELQPEAYGVCRRCNDMVYDSWRYEDPYTCPGCGGRLIPLADLPYKGRPGSFHSVEERYAMSLNQCFEDGCFGEGFAYPVPLRPTMLIKIGDKFTDEYGGERSAT